MTENPRRDFLKSAASAVFTTAIFTGSVRGANDKPTIAHIGMGRMGMSNLGFAMRQESLQVVAGPDLAGSVLDTLSSLIDHNLVYSAADPDGEPRFDMLFVVREFALEQLLVSNEAEVIRRRHSDHAITLTERASEHYYGPEATFWLDQMDREHDNIRAALGYFAEIGANIYLKWREWQARRE